MPRLPLPRALATLILFGLLVGSAHSLHAQPPGKKSLTFADYDIWRSATGVTLSRDGQFVAYLVGPETGDGEAVVRHIASGKEYKFARGSGGGIAGLGTAPRFTPDSKRVLLPLTPTKAQLDKAKADKLKADEFPKAAVAIVDLATGQETERLVGATAVQVGGEGAGFLIYRKPTAPETPKTDGPEQPTTPPVKGKFPGKGGQPPGKGVNPGTPTPPARATGSDLYLRDLASGAERAVAEVAEYSLSNDETTLVYVVSSKNEDKNGVYSLNPKFGTAGSPLKAGPGRYSSLTWDEKQSKLAFFYDDSQVPAPNVAPPPHPVGSPVGTPIPGSPPPAPRYRVFVWDRNAKTEPKAITRVPLGAVGGFASLTDRMMAATAPAPVVLDEVFGPNTPGLKKGWTISGASLSFSQDGSKLFLAAAPVRPPQTASTPPGADDFQLDLWHWKDANIQPMQKLQAAQDRARTYGAVVFLDSKQFKHLSDENNAVQPPGVGDWAVSGNNSKYRYMTGYTDAIPSDYAIVNVRTGESRPLATASAAAFTPSPNGKYLLTFDGRDWHSVSVPDGKKVNLTAGLGVKFFNEEHDTPNTPSPYGAATWTPDGKFVLATDRFDTWKIAADGSGAENVTKIGRTLGVRFTLLKPRSPDDRSPFDRTVDLSRPHLLYAENLTTRDTGFYRLEPGAAPKMLLMGARSYGFPTKAKDADVYLLTVQTFSQYPDYYITTPDFHELKRVTDINPHVKNYAWGKSELIKYTSGDGQPLQGILIKPENFDPNKKYPMVVYIYERLSENLHRFVVPNVQRGQIINPTFYASNGYLVLMPDIAYKVGAPGPSAMKCVLPAIQAVADKGYVDEKAIGINGQSWGGYQIAYMVTQTNRF
ncbi:MAG: hypothetical protein K2V38_09740, partial [Gemmataceae bacterium]|nr:hypothetical protein [Gemmataceae bacterium]